MAPSRTRFVACGKLLIPVKFRGFVAENYLDQQA
jgi:hypothetical protein